MCTTDRPGGKRGKKVPSRKREKLGEQGGTQNEACAEKIWIEGVDGLHQGEVKGGRKSMKSSGKKEMETLE